MAKKSKKKPAKNKSPKQRSAAVVAEYGTNVVSSDARTSFGGVAIDEADFDDNGMQITAHVNATVALDLTIVDPDGNPTVDIIDTSDVIVATDILEVDNTGPVGAWKKEGITGGGFTAGETYLFRVTQKYRLKPIPGEATDTVIRTA